MSDQEVNDAESLDQARTALAARIDRWTKITERLVTEIPGLLLRRWEHLTDPITYLHEPSICLLTQGAKRVMLKDDVYVYDANTYLITSVGLPVVAEVIEASKEKPYLGLMLQLDQRLIAQLMVERDLPQPRKEPTRRGMATGEMTPQLLNAFIRLVDLLDSPEDIPILAPLVQREILYRLLVGEQGERLRQIASAGSHSNQIARAIDWLKSNYNQSLRVDDLAGHAGMSTSTFHHHFRELTAMSPLQYQKWLRLNEARQLMITKRLDAATAAFQVGYESPSQFSREYSRLFGASPARDVKQLGHAGRA